MIDLHLGDCLDVLKGMEDNSFDGVLTDPPYGLSFMSKAWDYGVPSAEVWAEVLRVCKPGAMLLAFGGTRTFHRLTCAIEDAGWEVRDVVCWLYGSGFPKSHDISKALDRAAGVEREVVGHKITGNAKQRMNGTGEFGSWANSNTSGQQTVSITAPATPLAVTWDGYGTALKPAWEPCIVAMKPTDGTFAQNALRWQVSGINVDGCRIGTEQMGGYEVSPGGMLQPSSQREQGYRPKWDAPDKPFFAKPASGRWPANLILDSEAAALLDQQSGERGAGHFPATQRTKSAFMASRGKQLSPERWTGDTGGASRFFYTAKASRREREAGLNETEPRKVNDGRQTPIDNAYQRGETLRRNTHPTLKPLALCEYLARLILPPAAYRDTARLLVPFAGSGSEMIGALQAGWRNVEGIEKEAEYVDIARRRLDFWQRQLRGNPRPLPDWIEADALEPVYNGAAQ